MPFDDELFQIPAYTHRNAQQVLDALGRPVNMLRLHSEIVDNETGERDIFSNRWELTPDHHYRYTIGLQPQPMEDSLNWSPKFQLDFRLADFLVLHVLLMQIKDTHLQLLAGRITEDGFREFTQESDRLCFQCRYSLSRNARLSADSPRGNRLVPNCISIDVYVRTPAGRYNIGTYSLYSGMRCMAGLILEAERLHAIIDGAEPEAVAAIEQVAPGPKTPYDRPSLVVVKSRR